MILFQTILYLCSMLARIFLVQCHGNLCNVDAVFVATWYYQKINQSKIKIAAKWFCSDNWLGLFMCNVVWILVDNIAKLFTCTMLFQEYKDNIDQKFFMCNVFWSLLDNIAQGFYLCNIVPRVLRQHWTELFLSNVAWSLFATCTRFLPLEPCPKCIFAMLSQEN